MSDAGTDLVLPADLVLHRELEAFLFHEAALLDAGRFGQWLELLADGIDYRIPVRLTRERTATDRQFSERSFHMVEDLGSLRARVARFDTEYAWSENPPSRTRRFVSNVRVTNLDGEVAEVRSNLLFSSARESSAAVLLSGERRDRIHRCAGGWKLLARLVLLDHTTLPLPNLAVFL